jgi:hypothetical protein
MGGLHDEVLILSAITEAVECEPLTPLQKFGAGNSTKKFMECLREISVWNVSKQKVFFAE